MKKRLICAFLVSSMILGNCVVYGEEAPAVTDDTAESTEAVVEYSDGAEETDGAEAEEADTAEADVAEAEAEEADTAEADVAEAEAAADETVSSQAAAAVVKPDGGSTSSESITDKSEASVSEGEDAENSPISAYAADTGFTEVPMTDDSGIQYTLTVNCNYKLDNNDTLCGQITNISKDVQCDATIPPEIEITLADGTKVMRKIRSVADSAFEAAQVKSVVLPETIREIGAKAFLNCTNMKTLKINGVINATKKMPMPVVDNDGNYVYTTLLDGNGKQVYDRYGKPMYAYQTDESGNIVYYDVLDEENLTTSSTTAKTMVTEIGANAFQGCTALEDVFISGFQKVGDSAFFGCTSLKNVDFSTDGMYPVSSAKKSASDGAGDFNVYTGKPSTTEMTTTLGKNFFENCTALTDITISKNVKTIGVSAFKGCENLKNVTIGKSLTGTMNVVSFEGCTKVENVFVDEESKSFTSLNGILCKSTGSGSSKKPTTLVYCPPKNKVQMLDADGLPLEAGVLELPSSVTSIEKNSVQNNLNLKKLITNGNVSIGETAFTGCDELISYTANGQAKIGKNAFTSSKKLKELYLNGFATIGDSAFMDCANLSTLYHVYNLGTTKQTIGTSAFENCTSLQGDLTLYGWAQIGKNAFKGCTSIINLVASESIGTIMDNAFEGCTGMETADLRYMGYNVAAPASSNFTFNTYVFKDCSSLKTAQLAIGLQGISTGTFQNCTSLESATTGENTGSICSLAFDNCPSLKTPPSPRFLVRIDANAFVNCSSIGDYPLTRSVMSIEPNSFMNCGNLKIIAPENSYAYSYAVETGFNRGTMQDDIADEEFLITSGNVITGYRGGFVSLTIPDNYFTKNGISSEYLHLEQKWIDNPVAGDDCSMKTYLKYIDIGEVNTIGTSALSGTVLEGANLRNAKYIFKSAFSSCKSLKAITIPGTVEVMDSSVFSGCTALENLTFNAPVITENKGSDGIPVIDSIENVPGIKFFTLTVNKDTTVKINTAKSNGQFSGCTSLKKVTVNTTKIHTNSNNADEKAKVKEVGTLTYVPENMFKGCTSLEGIELPYNCKSPNKDTPAVGKTAFYNCNALEHLKFGALTDNIGELAFQNCTSLKTITLPHNVTVGKNAFKGCTFINRIVIPQTAKLAISDTPFIDTFAADVICDKNSNNLTYFKAFNDPENNLDLFMSEDIAKTYANKYFYNITYGEFLEGIDYVVVKGKITIPDGVTVKKGTTTLKTGDFVVGGDVLTITAPQSEGMEKLIYANGKPVAEDGSYTVPENEDITISIVTRKKCKLSIGSGVTITKDGAVLANNSYVSTGDSLVITADPSKEGTLVVNGAEFVSGSTYFVEENVETLKAEIMTYAYGDVNMDGIITAQDSSCALQGVLDGSFLNPQAFILANVSGDEILTADDAALILQRVLDSSFPFAVEKK